MRPELIVAGKEIRDHVTSKRFIIVFAILLLISIYSIATGMNDYNTNLEYYKQNQQQQQQQQWFKDQVAALQQQIADAQARGESQEMIDSLQYQLDQMLNPPMPSVMSIFYSLNVYFVWICALLAIALGFDLITREKEEGSLKSLLSHPIYRDSVINGKTLGAISVLTAAMGATFLITIAIVLFFGVVPSLDELLRIGAYFLMALLLCLAFFAVAMAASTLARNSSMAVLYALGVVIVLAGLSMFSYQIVNFVVGPPPDNGGPIVYAGGAGMEGDFVKTDLALAANVSDTGSSPVDSSSPPSDGAAPTRSPDDAVDPMPVPIVPGEKPGSNDEWQKWMERQQLALNAISSISPITNFQNNIANTLFSDYALTGPVRAMAIDSKLMPYYYQQKKTSVWDALGSIWVNILVLIAEVLAAFGIAYIKFLRTDIR